MWQQCRSNHFSRCPCPVLAPRHLHPRPRLHPHPRQLLFGPYKSCCSILVNKFFLHEVLASSPPFLPLNTSKVRIDTSVIIDGERMILPHNGDAHILVGQVNLWVRCSFLKRAGPVPTSLGRVSLSALRPCFTSSSNSHSCRWIIRRVLLREKTVPEGH